MVRIVLDTMKNENSGLFYWHLVFGRMFVFYIVTTTVDEMEEQFCFGLR